ncbi:MAG: hypothetical protein K8U57_08295 [Planctomycetes bacterium]|nr:hypothetical protein [Planctomycetota bacterium]
MSRLLAPVFLFAMLGTTKAAEPPFRIDGGDEKLPWFQLKAGKFPPEGSAHAVSGELIALDHVNRTGLLRPDRDDTQRRGDWDIARPFVMLPFGSFSYHGAPAELRDIPIGTHLHGQFYADPQQPPAKKGQPLPPATFTRAIKFEDDFSFNARQGRSWRVDGVAADLGTLTLTGIDKDGKADPKPITFKIGATTRVWKGKGFGTLADIAAGQTVQVNLTVCTLKGPGRVSDIWLDAESRSVATAHQLEVHRLFQREHGLAGWVVAVDNKKGIVEVLLFGGFDPKLVDAFTPQGTAAAAVAEDSLRTWDQINDVKRGPVVAVDRGTPAFGSSGVRVQFKPSALLEGYRPGRVVRLFSGEWKVDDLPREERLYP